MLSILEGTNKEEVDYNTYFLEDNVANMEGVEVGEEVKEIIKRGKKKQGTKIVEQQQHNRKKAKKESYNEIY